MLQHFLFILAQPQCIKHQRIAFYQLAGRKTQGNSRCLGMVLYQMHNSVETPMNRAVVVILVAEIRPPRPLLILGNMERVIDQFLYTLVLGR